MLGIGQGQLQRGLHVLKVSSRALGDQQFSDSDESVFADCVFVVFEVLCECLGDGRTVLAYHGPKFHAEVIDELTGLLKYCKLLTFFISAFGSRRHLPKALANSAA